jgi:outer membrane protein OmpA-like peptidoglycan-associated protein
MLNWGFNAKSFKEKPMTNRRQFLKSVISAASVGVAAGIVPNIAFAQGSPNAARIEGALSAAPKRRIRREERVERKDLRRRRDFREAAPTIDIQSINFDFGSANISRNEYWKVEEIAIAMHRILKRNRDEVFLIEGHTDAVGSNYANQNLSEARAASLKYLLVRQFGLTPYALETVGYGEDYLLVQTPYAEYRNRRVTLRRVTDFVRR